MATGRRKSAEAPQRWPKPVDTWEGLPAIEQAQRAIDTAVRLFVFDEQREMALELSCFALSRLNLAQIEKTGEDIAERFAQRAVGKFFRLGTAAFFAEAPDVVAALAQACEGYARTRRRRTPEMRIFMALARLEDPKLFRYRKDDKLVDYFSAFKTPSFRRDACRVALSHWEIFEPCSDS